MKIALPKLLPQDVLVKLRAVSVNPVDLKVRKGLKSTEVCLSCSTLNSEPPWFSMLHLFSVIIDTS